MVMIITPDSSDCCLLRLAPDTSAVFDNNNNNQCILLCTICPNFWFGGSLWKNVFLHSRPLIRQKVSEHAGMAH